ncbi:HAMP domain-containing histidine kinase [Hazenella sp. IB182353]|uniref:sensor histidine kinase n=1 Tax=Polycladospora coralii TaxID=2771432 RepID=UPI001747B8B0|nr:HAMP domain-containing sensor histidine kinase [Polycladospora coralii]MBS7528967.1 HAMP domain-containing histidine kinase [Polycladospora coralii]
MKSLYLQVVSSFLGAVLISLVFAFFVSSALFETHALNRVDEQLREASQTVIHLYQAHPNENVQTYIRNLDDLNFHAMLYQENEKIAQSNSTEWRISDAVVQSVLRGDEYKGEYISNQYILGVPFQAKGVRYALFISPDYRIYMKDFHMRLFVVLFMILVVGSILFFITTRYLIKPIQALTSATKKLARGDFRILLETNRRDELGDLTVSFNRMAHELGQLDHLRQQFVANVSHEIQSPLTSIHGFTQALKSGIITDPAEQRRVLSIIESESKRLSKLSKDLLHLATLDVDKPSFCPSWYDVDEQLRRVIVALEPQWQQKKQTLAFTGRSAHVFADSEKLEQVWVNLITNAIKYTPDAGQIHITVKESSSRIQVCISDSGIGIEEKHLPFLFDRFYKIDHFYVKGRDGSGLGLAITQKIVHLHKGSIEVMSKKDEGTTFVVDLPKSERDD